MAAGVAADHRLFRSAQKIGLPGLRQVNVRSVQLTDRWAAEQHERALDIGFQDGDSARDAALSASRQPVAVSAADQYSLCAHADRLHDIGPAADASIDENLGLPANGFQHF